MTGVVIRLGDADKTDNKLLRILGTILSNEKSVKDKIDVLKEYDVPMTQTVERKVGSMYGLGDLIAEKAAKIAAEEQKEKDIFFDILKCNY